MNTIGIVLTAVIAVISLIINLPKKEDKKK